MRSPLPSRIRLLVDRFIHNGRIGGHNLESSGSALYTRTTNEHLNIHKHVASLEVEAGVKLRSELGVLSQLSYTQLGNTPFLPPEGPFQA